MESFLQVSSSSVSAAATDFIAHHDEQQLNNIWKLAQTRVTPGLRLFSYWIVKPVVAEKAFQALLEMQDNYAQYPDSEWPHELYNNSWYDRAKHLLTCARLSKEEEMWISVTDACAVSDILYMNGWDDE